MNHLILFTTSAFAAEYVTPRASSYFGKSCVYLHETSDTTFEAWFEVTALRGMDEIGASTIKVQKSTDGEHWTTMKTYTKEVYSNLICKNTITHASCVSYIGSSGCYYRAIIELYAKDETGWAEMTEYTAVIQLP